MTCRITVKLPDPSPLKGSVKRLSPLFEEAYLDLAKLKEIVSPYWEYFLGLLDNFNITSFEVEEKYHVDGRKVFLAVYMTLTGNIAGELEVSKEGDTVKIHCIVPLKGAMDPLKDLLQAMEKEYDRIKGIFRSLTPLPHGDIEVMIE